MASFNKVVARRRCGALLLALLGGAAWTLAPAFTGGLRAGPLVNAAASPKQFAAGQLRPARTARAAGAFLPLDAIEPAITSYVNIWTPYFQIAKESGLAPEFLLRWGHAAAMGTVLFLMGGYGAFLGWSTRLGNGEAIYPLSLGQTARELHPTLMALALFFFFLGGQGGLVLLATAGQPILQSAHSSTAVLGLGLMAGQAVLGKTMGNSEAARTAHAFLGTGVLLLLVLHAYFGLGLGQSF